MLRFVKKGQHTEGLWMQVEGKGGKAQGGVYWKGPG
jgi:hypothetical protein